jgi:hypothetical protein
MDLFKLHGRRGTQNYGSHIPGSGWLLATMYLDKYENAMYEVAEKTRGAFLDKCSRVVKVEVTLRSFKLANFETARESMGGAGTYITRRLGACC